MSAFLNFWRRIFGLSPADEEKHLPYMNKVDAALLRKGKFGAVSLSIGTAVLICALLVWAGWASIDEITRAQGQVVAASGTQVIQNLEGGILREVLVREGEVVEADQPWPGWIISAQPANTPKPWPSRWKTAWPSHVLKRKKMLFPRPLTRNC